MENGAARKKRAISNKMKVEDTMLNETKREQIGKCGPLSYQQWITARLICKTLYSPKMSLSSFLQLAAYPRAVFMATLEHRIHWLLRLSQSLSVKYCEMAQPTNSTLQTGIYTTQYCSSYDKELNPSWWTYHITKILWQFGNTKKGNVEFKGSIAETHPNHIF